MQRSTNRFIYGARDQPSRAMADNEERHSNLRPVVERYLAGGGLTATELEALRAYLVRFIEGKKQTIARLAEEAPHLREREEFARWFREARLHDFDPVE